MPVETEYHKHHNHANEYCMAPWNNGYHIRHMCARRPQVQTLLSPLTLKGLHHFDET